MKATLFGLLALGLLVVSTGATPSQAAVYSGKTFNGRPCSITLQKAQGKVWVGVDSRVYPVDYKISDTHFVSSRTETDAVLFSVRVSAKLIDAFDFRSGRARSCRVILKK